MRAMFRAVTPVLAIASATLVGAGVALAGATAAGAGPAATPGRSVTLTPRQSAFLATVAGPARASQRRYGVPASAVIAQAILETGWGDSTLARTAHNYFGMTCTNGRPGRIATGCKEGRDRLCDPLGCRRVTAEFRVYRSTADSFRDHGRLFATSRRYSKAYANRTNPTRFIAEMHRAGYATDPQYATLITKIMVKYDLRRYNRR